MKTRVREIMINGEYGPVTIRMQMPNGDLKRRYLYRLLQYGVVTPSDQVTQILFETLKELDVAYHIIRNMENKNAATTNELCAINNKHTGEVEDLESYIEELKDDISDLQADLAEMHCEKTATEALASGMLLGITENSKSVH